MTTALLDDEFWRVIEPLLPVRKRRFHHPGRKRLDDRRTLAGILFVLRTGIAWKRVPRCGCGWYLTSLQNGGFRLAGDRTLSPVSHVSGFPGFDHRGSCDDFPVRAYRLGFRLSLTTNSSTKRSSSCSNRRIGPVSTTSLSCSLS